MKSWGPCTLPSTKYERGGDPDPLNPNRGIQVRSPNDVCGGQRAASSATSHSGRAGADVGPAGGGAPVFMPTAAEGRDAGCGTGGAGDAGRAHCDGPAAATGLTTGGVALVSVTKPSLGR